MAGETVVSGRGGPDGEGPAAADIDEKVFAEASRRGLITPAQGRAALEEARSRGVPLLEVLRGRGLVDEEAARDLDEEIREDFVPGYRVLSKLGEGGMGVVYRALQKRLDREVALKVVTPRLAADDAYLRRFEREAKAVARLNHPNIVAAYDFGESGGRVFLAMEFVEGTNCAEWLRRHGPMEEARALAVVREVAAGLAHAAAAGIIHRDIKPANVLLCDRGAGVTGAGTAAGAKVTDLGLARVGDAAGTTELTAAGTILGTPGYMAPEQAFGREIDARADIYALGATLYQLVTGHRPFEASTPVAMIARQQSEQLPDPRDLRPGLSANLVALLQGMLARDPSTRYPGYRELRVDLDRVAAGEPPALPPPPAAQRTLAPSVAEGATLEAPAGTVILPGGGREDTGEAAAAAAAPSVPSGGETGPPAAARRSRLPLLAAVAVVVVAGLVLANTRPWRRPPADGGAPTGDAGRAASRDPGEGDGADPGTGADPDPDPDLDPDPDRIERDLPAAMDRRDGKVLIAKMVEAKRRWDALPAAERRRHPERGRRIDASLDRARRLAEERITGLWKEGEYEKALAEARWLKEALQGESGAAIDRLAETLEGIGDRGAAERGDLRAAREGRRKNDPLAVLAALDGFEEKYPFTPDREAVREARRWAEVEAPEYGIGSRPPGAAVLLGGRDHGRTPLKVRLPAGEHRLVLRLAGYEDLERTLEVRRGVGEELAFALEPLPPPDPEPEVERAPEGNPRPLWTGASLGAWSIAAGQWGVSLPGRTAWLEGEEGPEPAAHLRGASGGLGLARLDLAPFVKEAPGWRLEWQMLGEGRRTGNTTRVEMHFAVRENGTALVLGIDDQDAYLGVRDPATGELARTHRLKGVAPNRRHTFVVENHGDVFRALVDGRRLGAVAVPADLVPAATIRAAVEGGAGFFSDITVRRMR